MTLYFKACPKCQGVLTLEREEECYIYYLSCMICGATFFPRDPEEDESYIHKMEKTAWRKNSRGSPREPRLLI